jgi:hypothetical protein
VIHVARADQFSGPFYTLRKNNAWVQEDQQRHLRPKVLISSLKPITNPGALGAGWPSAVVRDGKVHFWFTDITDAGQEIYYVKFDDIVAMNFVNIKVIKKGQKEPCADGNRTIHSPEIKYDEAVNRFVMVVIHCGHGKSARLDSSISRDGISWAKFVKVRDLPWYAHNVGISGDHRGWLLNGSRKPNIGFGATSYLSEVDLYPAGPSQWSLFLLPVDRVDLIERHLKQ